jgi:hypothetical protein
MVRVNMSANELKIFKTKKELEELDEQVNRFLADERASGMVPVSHAVAPGGAGGSIGSTGWWPTKSGSEWACTGSTWHLFF